MKTENKVLKNNQEALLNDVERYKTESGKNAATVQTLILDYNTLQKKYSVISKAADDLGIKLKKAQSVSEHGIKTEYIIKTAIRDSIIIRDGAIDSISIVKWSDAWVNIHGEILKDSIQMNVCSRDTLIQIVHKVPHRFWFIKWGCKAIKQEIVSTNPHTEIEYTNYIEIK